MTHGYDGLLLATLMAGASWSRRARAPRNDDQYIPEPVVTGFTSGIAVIIFSSQVRDFFGLEWLTCRPTSTKGRGYRRGAAVARAWTCCVGPAALLLILAAAPCARSPGFLVGVAVASPVVTAAGVVETIGGRFGGIPAACRRPMPAISMERA